MGKSTISMAMFNSYFDITRGYPARFFPTFKSPVARPLPDLPLQTACASWPSRPRCRCDDLTPQGTASAREDIREKYGKVTWKVWKTYGKNMGKTYGKKYGKKYGKNMGKDMGKDRGTNMGKNLGKNMGKFWFFYPIVSDAHFCSEWRRIWESILG